MNAGGNAEVLSVSCASAGNCAAGGFYHDRRGHGEAFVASELHGRWGTAIEVPGTATLNAGGNAEVLSVSCTSAGNCAAGGFYYSSPNRHAFVVSQRNRRWVKAIEVPGIESSNTDRGAEVLSVSCASAGNCAAGGLYAGSSFGFFSQAFVASEQNGRWGSGIEVPGTATLNSGTNAEVTSVSCNRPGPCTAGGFYTESTEHSQGFIISRS